MAQDRSIAAEARTILGNPGFQALAIALSALALYVRTMAPTVMWYDMGEFQTAANTLGIAHNTGYPLYLMLGKLFSFLPVGDPAHRISMTSAVFGSATIAVEFLIIRRLIGRSLEAALASITFAVTSTLWSNSTWAEVYTLNAFLTGLIVLLIIQYRDCRKIRSLLVASFLFGLGTGNHRLIIGVALPLAYAGLFDLEFSLGRLHFRRSAWMVGAFLLGFVLVQAYLPIRSLARPAVQLSYPDDLGTFLRVVTTGAAKTEAFYNPFGDLGHLRHWLTILTVYPTYELTLVGLLIAAVGVWRMRREARRMLWVTAAIGGFALATVSTYGIHDIFNYFLPIYQMAMIWFGFGLAALLGLVGRPWPAALEERLHFWTPARRVPLMAAAALLIPAVLAVRNFRVLDRSGHYDPADYADFIWSTVDSGSVVLADFWAWTPLLYDQVINHQGQGITVAPAFSNPNLDVETQLELLEASGTRTYAALRREDIPGNSLGEYTLRLVAPYPVRGFPTDTNPLPSYKELLVPRGGLYRVVRGVPDPAVATVPDESRLPEPVVFGDTISLEGFAIDVQQVAVGGVYKLSYYWRLDDVVPNDLWVDVLFTHADGTVDTTGGIPVWLASHWVGTGARSTSSWPGDRIMRETLSGIVPRDVNPGSYELRLVMYGSGVRAGLMPARTGDAPAGAAVVVGSIAITE